MRHASAVIDASAEIANDAEVGPFAVIVAHVTLGARTIVGAHAIVVGPTTMGAHNDVHSFAAVGGSPQDKRNIDAATHLVIGDHNVFREHVTIHRGTKDTHTRIGSHNLFMVGAHVAHDAVIGSHCVIANGVQLAGHTRVEDHVTFGGLAGVAQFVVIGEGAFVAAGSMVERDVPPFVIVQGDRARVRAVNKVGLARRGVSKESIHEIERIFRAVYLHREPRARVLSSLGTSDPYGQRLLDALRVSSSSS